MEPRAAEPSSERWEAFEPGYELDAVVLDDAELQHPQELDLAERLERLIYLSDDRHIAGKFVAGRRIFR